MRNLSNWMTKIEKRKVRIQFFNRWVKCHQWCFYPWLLPLGKHGVVMNCVMNKSYSNRSIWTSELPQLGIQLGIITRRDWRLWAALFPQLTGCLAAPQLTNDDCCWGAKLERRKGGCSPGTAKTARSGRWKSLKIPAGAYANTQMPRKLPGSALLLKNPWRAINRALE